VVAGNYKVQAYDQNVKDYMPVSPGIGMLVEVRDPEDKVILSRVSCHLLHSRILILYWLLV
jgi:hypothetical protein